MADVGKLVMAVLAGIGGAIALPFLLSGLTGALAGFFAGAGRAVPTVLMLDFLSSMFPAIALVGFVGAAWWVMQR